MKNIKLTLILFFCLFVIACSKEAKDLDLINQGTISDPFENTANNNEKNYNGSYKVKSDKNGTINFEGDKISMNLTVSNYNTDIELGFFTLINGIPQMFENGSIMSNISLKPQEILTLPIDVIPNYGKKNDVLRMDIPSMFFPNSIPEDEKYQFGNRQRIMCGRPYTINFIESSNDKNVDILCLKNNRYPTDAENRKYDLVNATVSIFEFSQANGESSTNYLVTNKENLKFKLMSYAAITETYRVTLYKNHMPVKINGHDAIDLQLEKGCVAELDVIIGDAKEGDFIYAFCTPVTNMDEGIEKTKTLKIFDNIPAISNTNNDGQIQGDEGKHIDNTSLNNSTFNRQVLNEYKAVYLLSVADNKLYFKGYKDNCIYIFCLDYSGSLLYTTEKNILYSFLSFKNSSDGFTCLSSDINKEKMHYIEFDDTLSVKNVYDISNLNIDKFGAVLENIDGLSNRIIYINDKYNIASYNVSLQEEFIIKDFRTQEATPLSVISIRYLNEDVACFTASENNNSHSYIIGNIDISSGEITYKSVDDIYATVYSNGETACWRAKENDIDKLPKEIINLYYKNKFYEIKCDTPCESQNVYISNDGNYIATYFEEEAGINVSVYNIENQEQIYNTLIKLDTNISYQPIICIYNNTLYIYISKHNDSSNDIFEIIQMKGL